MKKQLALTNQTSQRDRPLVASESVIGDREALLTEANARHQARKPMGISQDLLNFNA